MAKTRKATGDRKGAKVAKKVATKAGKKAVRAKAASPRKAGKAAGRTRRAAPAARAPKTPKTYLSRKELREFRQMLLVKRATLLGDLYGMEQQAARRKAAGDLSSLPTHMADVGTDTFEHEFTLGLLESEQALLREIDEQLQRIEQGTYGVCMGTGQPIPKARLRAKPWAKYTVEYTRLLEKGLARPPDASEEG